MTRKAHVAVKGTNKVITVEEGATKGATLGVNLYDQNGDLLTLAALALAIGAIAPADEDPQPEPALTIWGNIGEIPSDPFSVLGNPTAVTARPIAIVSTDPTALLRHVAEIDTATIVAVGHGISAYSNDGGRTWTNSTTPISTGNARDDVVLALYDSTRTTFYAFGGLGSRSIWRSTDGGVNWTETQNVLPNVAGINIYDGVYIAAHDALVVVGNANAGANARIFVSLDGGVSFTSIIPTGTPTDHNMVGIAYDDDNDEVFVIGGTGSATSEFYCPANDLATQASWTYVADDMGKPVTSSAGNRRGAAYFPPTGRGVVGLAEVSSFVAGGVGVSQPAGDYGGNWFTVSAGTVNNGDCCGLAYHPPTGLMVGIWDTGTSTGTNQAGIAKTINPHTAPWSTLSQTDQNMQSIRYIESTGELLIAASGRFYYSDDATTFVEVTHAGAWRDVCSGVTSTSAETMDWGKLLAGHFPDNMVRVLSGDLFEIEVDQLNLHGQFRVDVQFGSSPIRINGDVGDASTPFIHITNFADQQDRRLLYLQETTADGFFIDVDLAETLGNNSIIIGSDYSGGLARAVEIWADGRVAFANDAVSFAAAGDLTIVNAGGTGDTLDISFRSTGDVILELRADTDNTGGENHNCFILFSQDGATVVSRIGLTGDVNLDPSGAAFSGAPANTLAIHHPEPTGTISLGTELVVALLINATNGVDVINGMTFRVMDATEADSIAWTHDGTNVACVLTGTTVYSMTGAAELELLNGMDLWIRDAGFLRIYDSGDTDYGQFEHNGTNFLTTFVNTTAWDISGATEIELTGGMDLWIRDAGFLRIYDSTDTDSAQFSHDGTNFLTAFTTTTDWRLTGLTTGFAVNSTTAGGLRIDIDNDSTDAAAQAFLSIVSGSRGRDYFFTTGSGGTLSGQSWGTGAPAVAGSGLYISDNSPFIISTNGVMRLQIDSTGVASTSVLRTAGYTVATLPAGTIGDRAYVTDALAPAYGAVAVGGGAVVVPVFYTGANWITA